MPRLTDHLPTAQLGDALHLGARSNMPDLNKTGIGLTMLVLLGSVSGLATQAAAQTAEAFETPEFLATNTLDYIGASAAYAAGFTGAGTLIAIIDDGFQLTHPEINGKIVDQFHTGWGSGDVPVGNHGTHVAASAAGFRDGSGMHGVAFDADLALYTYGYGFVGDAPNASVAGEAIWMPGAGDAFRRAANLGAAVISNSWGQNDLITDFLPGGRYADDPALAFGWLVNNGAGVRAPTADDRQQAFDFTSAMNAAQDRSVLLFAISNDASMPDIDISAGLPLVVPDLREAWIAVANVHAGPEVTYTPEGWPRPITHQPGELISAPCGLAAEFCISAVGTQVYSAYATPPDSYATLIGTSMATPHVAGAVAIARQMFPNATPAELTQLVLRTATDIGEPGIDRQFGWGLLNLRNLTEVAAPSTAQTTPLTEASQISTMGSFMDVMNGQAAFRGASTGARVVQVSTRNLPGTDGFPPSDSLTRRAWFSPMGEVLNVNGGATWQGYQSRAGGAALGYEFAWSDALRDWRVGAAVGVSRSSTQGDNGSSSGHANGFHAGVYAGMVQGGWEFDGSLQLALLQQDQFRHGVGGGGAIAQTAHGIFSSRALEANARLGYAFNRGDLTLKPYLSLEHRRLHRDGYTETGAGAFNLTVPADTIIQTEIGPGLRTERAFETETGGIMTAAIDTSISFVMGDHTPSSQATLLGRTITAPGVNLGREVVSLGAELAWQEVAGRFDAVLRYDGRFRNNAASHAISAYLTMTF